ncbi:MAG: NAD-dependent epimerase [Bacteroidales bacterium]|nr:NAD-dependent epimerase [Bacteroidales bacterium]
MSKKLKNSKILITGAAGFIGFHLSMKLLEEGYEIIGLDNINDYYDLNLKFGRLAELGIVKDSIRINQAIHSAKYDKFRFYKINLEDKVNVYQLFQKENFDRVVNLGAQAGVRYSLENPHSYIESNINGFLNILEACRHNKVEHLVYASSSSVYGLNEKMPFNTSDNVDHPISIYAATKKSNELMAHTYSYLFGLPTTGLRFFTVYGPWGRPDMALFLFTKAILKEEPIKVFNHGNMLRDFTYVDDIVGGIQKVLFRIPEKEPEWSGKSPDPSSSVAPYKVYNIGNNQPVKLLDFIEAIESALGKKAIKEMLPLQPGDVPATFADVSGLVDDFNYKPNTSYKDGIRRFVQWYREFYKV